MIYSLHTSSNFSIGNLYHFASLLCKTIFNTIKSWKIFPYLQSQVQAYQHGILYFPDPYLILWLLLFYFFSTFPGGSDSKESASSVEDLGSIPGSGRSPEGANGYPLQYSCLENSIDRGGWRATAHGVA